jgi:hypothetical protein
MTRFATSILARAKPKFIIKNPSKLAIIRNNALFLIKAAVIKKTWAIVYYALDQADR